MTPGAAAAAAALAAQQSYLNAGAAAAAAVTPQQQQHQQQQQQAAAAAVSNGSKIFGQSAAKVSSLGFGKRISLLFLLAFSPWLKILVTLRISVKVIKFSPLVP